MLEENENKEVLEPKKDPLEEKAIDEEHANEGVHVEGENLSEEDAQKHEEAKKAILEAIKKDVIAKSGMSEEDAAMAMEMLEEADMPVAITDDDFKLGRRELDIRKLSDENYKQIIFRTLITQGVWLRNVSNLLVDVLRLIYVELDAMGVKDILKKTDVVLAKINKERDQLVAQQILANQKKN